MAPMFSVLVPVYNAGEYLEDCVRSLQEQSCQDFEVVLVDDGSTDGSGQVCDRLAAEDPRIRAYHKENGGQLHTRLAAMEQANGEYFVFLDSDDTLVPHALETIREAFCRTGSDCILYEIQRVWQGKIIDSVPEKPEETITEKRELYRRCFTTNGYNSMCCKAVRAEVCTRRDYTGYYHLRHAEDLLQSIDILKNCRSVTFLHRALYNYTNNPNSVTQKRSADTYRVDFTVRQAVLDFLQQEGVFTEADYRMYRTVCIRTLLREAKTIGRLKTGTAQKKALLCQVRDHAYYRDFLMAGDYDKKRLGKDAMLLSMLKKKQDGLLLAVLKLSAMLRG